MSVRSRSTTPRHSTGHAPLDRAILDSAASPVRVFFGIVFLGWSWVSTVIIGGDFLAPAFGSTLIPGVSDSYVLAFAFALFVTFVEFVSAGRWVPVYLFVLLALDAPFTSYQTYVWLTSVIGALTMPATISTGGAVVIGFVSVVCGIVAAIFGELLLFGRRE